MEHMSHTGGAIATRQEFGGPMSALAAPETASSYVAAQAKAALA